MVGFWLGNILHVYRNAGVCNEKTLAAKQQCGHEEKIIAGCWFYFGCATLVVVDFLQGKILAKGVLGNTIQDTGVLYDIDTGQYTYRMVPTLVSSPIYSQCSRSPCHESLSSPSLLSSMRPLFPHLSLLHICFRAFLHNLRFSIF